MPRLDTKSDDSRVRSRCLYGHGCEAGITTCQQHLCNAGPPVRTRPRAKDCRHYKAGRDLAKPTGNRKSAGDTMT